MKNRDIITLTQAILKHKDRSEGTAKWKFAVARNAKKVKAEYDEYQSALTDLIERMMRTDDDGQPVYPTEAKQGLPIMEHPEAFNDELNALMDTEVDVRLVTVGMEEAPDYLTIEDIEAMMPIFE